MFISIIEWNPCSKEWNTLEHTHADGLKKCIKDSFQHIGITPLSSKLAAMNVDSAAVNTDLYSGLGAKFKENAP